MVKEEIKLLNVDYDGQTIALGVIRKELDKYHSFVGSLTEVDRLNKRCGTSVRLIRPEVADYILMRGKYINLLKDYSPFAVGAIVAHEERANYSSNDRQFGKEVCFYTSNQTVSLTTGKHKGEIASVLVITNPTLDDLIITGGKSVDIRVVVPPERIKVLGEFPSKCGWYFTDPETAIPAGREVEETKDARYLGRFQKPKRNIPGWDPVIPNRGTYVGPIYRSALSEDDFYPAGKGVIMAPMDTKGIVVEILNSDLGKLEEKEEKFGLGKLVRRILRMNRK